MCKADRESTDHGPSFPTLHYGKTVLEYNSDSFRCALSDAKEGARLDSLLAWCLGML